MQEQERRSAKEEREAHDEQDVYLLDLAASMFAIMLLYLLVAAHQVTSAKQEEQSAAAGRSSKEPRTLDFQLSTWRPFNIVKETWILHQGVLAHLNYRAIAKHYLENGTEPLRFSPSRADPSLFLGNVRIVPLSTRPGGLPTEYRMEYQLGIEADIGLDAVHDMSCRISGSNKSGGAAAKQRSPFDPASGCKFIEPLTVHVFGQAGNDELHFLQELQKAKPASEFVFDKGNSRTYQAGARREQAAFAFDLVYR